MNLSNHIKVEPKNNLITNTKYIVLFFKLEEQCHLPLKIWDGVDAVSFKTVTAFSLWTLHISGLTMIFSQSP